jgi:subtilisin family serine protease
MWRERTGKDVKIAVIDTGMSKSHPDLIVDDGINLTKSISIRAGSGGLNPFSHALFFINFFSNRL